MIRLGKQQAALLAVLLCAACSPNIESTNFQQIESNQFKIESGHTTSWFGNAARYVNATTSMGVWQGSFAGGEPMVPRRKDLLMSMVSAEAQRICMGQSYSLNGQPEFNMLDTKPIFFGGGLLGYALAAGVSEYENLPTGVMVEFYCPSDPR